MISFKVRKVGGSLGVILPKEALERLKVAEGDTVFLTEAPGGYRIVNYDPALEQELEAARKTAKKWRPLPPLMAKEGKAYRCGGLHAALATHDLQTVLNGVSPRVRDT